MIIGIPRALTYWKHPYLPSGTHLFWSEFFKKLDINILLSPPTNKEIVELGSKISDPETCFSVKVFWGHLLSLENKVDFIFVPRLKTNKDKFEYCLKFFALPDIAKILTKTPILCQTFDERKEEFFKSIKKLGKKLNKSKKEVITAVQAGLLKEKEEEEKKKKRFFEKIKSNKRKIILISHPYILYDQYVNVGIEQKLKKEGVEPIFIDEVFSKNKEIETDKKEFGYPDFHWEFAREIMEKINEILKYNIQGAIEISSFQCGSDAVLKEFVEKKFKKREIPFLYLIVDEQSGEAGVQTRIEAFIDTLN